MLYLMEVMQFFLGLRHRGLRPVETVSTVSRICAEQNWGSINLVTASEKSLACSSATKVVVLVGSMAFLSEFLNVTILLVTRPFLFFMRTCSFILKTFVVVVQTWLELLKTSVSLHLNIFWTTLMWIIAIVSLPGRFLAALRRER
ncbi:uncharacterized protein LOC127151345 [Cucumis melo]|uniref:Uncharacterized protein LOC127151345 n=1 Tax=Cucumis melo TaxID=3656 RepID=A0ABM3L9V0_CUCME|nr:uncharacterized protein LOC127151345 [Cucumis melo]